MKAFDPNQDSSGVIPIVIAGRRLEFHTIQNWEPYIRRLSEEGDAYLEKFPFWIRIWEASIVLAEHLIRNLQDSARSILEIGAGMGVVGMFLGAFGHRVVISDGDDAALSLLRVNAKHNGLENVSITKLDWNSPNLIGKYDIVCGSEVIFNNRCFSPLRELLTRYVTPSGAIYLSHDIRHHSHEEFAAFCSGMFEIQSATSTLRNDDVVQRVRILRFRARPNVSASK